MNCFLLFLQFDSFTMSQLCIKKKNDIVFQDDLTNTITCFIFNILKF